MNQNQPQSISRSKFLAPQLLLVGLDAAPPAWRRQTGCWCSSPCSPGGMAIPVRSGSRSGSDPLAPLVPLNCGLVGRLLIGDQGRRPVLVGDAEPAAGLLEGLGAALLQEVGIAAAPAGRRRPARRSGPRAGCSSPAIFGSAVARDQRVGMQERSRPLVLFSTSSVTVNR